MQDLKGKKILVTGGGGEGVGGGICQALDKCGATIVLNEMNWETAEAACEKYSRAIPIVADVSDGQQVADMFEIIGNEVGLLDGLVNNAGVGLNKLAHEASEQDFQKLYDIDIKGLWQVSKFFVQQLLKQGSPGSIVNVSSVNALATMPRFAVYASAKSAVEGLTMGMAVELGTHSIRVNAIGPGQVLAKQSYDLAKAWTNDPETWFGEFTQKKQAIKEDIRPIECGNVAAFLLSDLSSGVTGQTIYVDKGTTSLI